MSGYFRKLRFTATRPTNAINTRASINISPRLILEFFMGLVIGMGFRLSTLDWWEIQAFEY